MGRMSDAMRRAGEPAPSPASPAAELSRTSFPAEAGVAEAVVAETTEPAQVHVEPAAETPAPAEADTPTTSAPIIERISVHSVEKIVASEAIMPASREQYRRLAAALHNAQESTGIKVVMVASAVVGEGKTLTASNLALTLSESYKLRVLLVDADLRRPSIDGLFGLAKTAGLREALMSPELHKLDLHDFGELSVLTAGRATSDPMSGLTSGNMRQIIDEARDLFDWVVIDTPPVVLLPDAHLLAAMVDGAVLVIRADATPHDLVQRAVEAIGKDKVLGVVLNGTKPEHQGTYKGYYGKYGYHGYYGGHRKAS